MPHQNAPSSAVGYCCFLLISIEKGMRGREPGLTSLERAAWIQLKTQTPQKGYFWLSVEYLSPLASYRDLGILHLCMDTAWERQRLGPSLALRCTEYSP